MAHNIVEEHVDLGARRERYEVAASRPAVQLADGLILLAGLYLAVFPWIVGFTGLDRLLVTAAVPGAFSRRR
ncbi:SPW repeat protein [Actinomadura sp. 6N118]|uniref:SPW repeat protein n=1 Tax=Actinomadura sp. 6N118 TaxID=3375151 RepID=UPI0037A1A63A